MKKVIFHTLGCKLNYAETSTLARAFAQEGYQQVTLADKPDVCVINTCSVTENADAKCNRLIREVRQASPNAYIALVGCYAQLKPKTLAEIPGVNAVVGTQDKFKLIELIEESSPEAKPIIRHNAIDEETTFNPSYSLHDRTRAFLKVQDGCSYSCSFCTIPLARGTSRSSNIASLTQTAREMADQGAKEIVLTGVNIGDFGLENNVRTGRFIDLVEALDQVEGIDRFRISSIEPNLITKDVIDFVASSERFVPHFHIPLQSGSNTILGLMRRRYRREHYREKINQIKARMPSCCIGADVIVGFPGEGQREFMETHALLHELDITYLHVFSYSKRNHTPAAHMEGKVHLHVRRERAGALRMLSEKKRRAFYTSQAGAKTHVLVENDIRAGRMHGFTANYIRTAIDHKPALINTLVPVQLTGVDQHGTMHADPL